jgi:hypothetical protein
MNKLWKTDFDDSLSRKQVIKFAKKVLDLKLKSNKELNKIDLINVDDLDMGVEVEHGKWNGDFWKNDAYCKISNLGFSTINIPIRKRKYWTEWNKGKYNKSHSKNLFIRSNKDFTQFIVIESKIIKDPKKLYVSKFQPNNSKEIEEWMSFKKKDVKTYNLIDGTFKLEKTK